jgi:hypothetical protein
MKVIITGMRDFHDYATVVRAVAASGFTVTEVVSGCAPGVDILGQRWAVEHLKPLKRFPADRKKHGEAAEPVRNRGMADYAEALVAIWDGQRNNTAGMIRQAKEKGLPVHVERVAPKPEEPPPPPREKLSGCTIAALFGITLLVLLCIWVDRACSGWPH